MKEILFRGKRTDNGEWVEGGFHKHIKRTPCPIGDSLEDDDIAYLIIESGFSDWNMPKPLFSYQVDPETVGQYTGLKDSTGKRIFEGDILKHFTNNPNPDSYFLAIVGHEAGAFCLLHIKGRYRIRNMLWDCPSDSYEVAGSIHDNPELLEV